METIIEEEGKKSHHEIAAKIEELIENEKEQKIIADVIISKSKKRGRERRIN